MPLPSALPFSLEIPPFLRLSLARHPTHLHASTRMQLQAPKHRATNMKPTASRISTWHSTTTNKVQQPMTGKPREHVRAVTMSDSLKLDLPKNHPKLILRRSSSPFVRRPAVYRHLLLRPCQEPSKGAEISSKERSLSDMFFQGLHRGAASGTWLSCLRNSAQG